MQTTPAPDEPISDLRDLPAFFSKAEKPRDLWRIGIEQEQLLVEKTGLTALPWPGVRRLLEQLALRDGFLPVWEDERPVGLTQGTRRVALEPGGQLEFCGSPCRTAGEVVAEMETFAAVLEESVRKAGCWVLALGLQPLSGPEAAPDVPRRAFRALWPSLMRQGRMAQLLFKLTASIQASIDFSDERDAVLKMRAAMGASSLVSALYANSPLLEGKNTGYASFRAVAWRHWDPRRSGLLACVWEDGFGYERYSAWALAAPMVCIKRNGEYLDCAGLSFPEYLRSGWRGHSPVWQDWETHLGMVFPEVRLQQRIELRGADAGRPEMMRAFPALWKGILYAKDACLAAMDLTRRWNFRERLYFQEEAAKHGLAAQHGKNRARDLVRELLEISAFGLREQQKIDGVPDETDCLRPLIHRVQNVGKSPGEELLEAHRRGEDIAAIVGRANYFGTQK